MTTKTDTPLMPAKNLTNTTTTTPTTGSEEVNTMALFESRKSGRRAWDELSAIDRAVLLESVRQRRKLLEKQKSLHHEIYGMRSSR